MCPPRSRGERKVDVREDLRPIGEFRHSAGQERGVSNDAPIEVTASKRVQIAHLTQSRQGTTTISRSHEYGVP